MTWTFYLNKHFSYRMSLVFLMNISSNMELFKSVILQAKIEKFLLFVNCRLFQQFWPIVESYSKTLTESCVI